jgi:hypothetical protein
VAKGRGDRGASAISGKKVFWFFFTKKNFFLKKEAKTSIHLSAFQDQAAKLRPVRLLDRHSRR